MIERQFAHLPRRRLHKPLFTEADRHTPQPRHRLDIFLAGIIIDMDTLAL